MRLSPAMTVGLVAGLLFFGHGMINESRAWPLIWPLLGGAAAVWFAARKHRLHGFWSGLGAGAGAGAVAAVLFFAATAVALAALGLLPREGADNPLVALEALGVAAAIGFGLAVLAGAAAYPFARTAGRTA